MVREGEIREATWRVGKVCGELKKSEGGKITGGYLILIVNETTRSE